MSMKRSTWVLLVTLACIARLACPAFGHDKLDNRSVDAEAWLAALEAKEPDACLRFIRRFPKSEFAGPAAQRMWWLLKQRMDAPGPEGSIARNIALRPLRADFLPLLVRTLTDFPPHIPYVRYEDASPYPWPPRIAPHWWLYALPPDDRERIFQELLDGHVAQLADADQAIRSAACRALGNLGNPAAVGPLLEIGKSDDGARWTLLCAIGELRSPRCKPFLLTRINAAQHAPIKARALPGIHPEIDALAALRDPTTVPVMVELTRSGHVGIRLQAAKALGIIGDAAGVQALIDRVCDEQEDDAVRLAAIDSLGRIGDPRAVSTLAVTMESEAYRRVSTASLGRIPSAEAVDVLVQEVLDQPDFLARGASQALADCEQPKSVPALLAALLEKRVSHVSFTMADEVSPEIFDGEKGEYRRFSCGTCVAFVWSFRSIDRLLLALQDARPGVRGSAAYAVGLAPVRDPRAVNVLLSLLDDDAVAASAAFSLGALGDASAVEPLIAALAHESPTVRRFAAHALGDLADPRAVPPLLKLVGDKFVGYAAVRALQRLKATSAALPLAAMLIDWPKTHSGSDTWAPPSAVDSSALQSEGLPHAGPPWRQLTRSDLLSALRELGNPQVCSILVPIAQDRSDLFSCNVARLIFDLGDPAGADLLFQLTSSANEEVRNKAAVQLGECADKRAAELLLPLLKDDHWQTRAARALGLAGDRRAVPVLLSLQTNEDNSALCEAAIEALGRIGDHAATEPLLQHLTRARKHDPHGLTGSLVSALVAIGDDHAVDPLLTPWKQGESPLNTYLATDFPGTKMIDAIASVMLDSAYNREIRSEAAAKLGYAKRLESLPPLRKALTDSEATVRASALLAIWQIQPPTDEDLEALIVDPEFAPSVGPTILHALTGNGRYPTSADEALRYLILAGARYDLIALWPRVERLLLADLHSNSPQRRLYAARCLVGIGHGKATVPKLVAALGKCNDQSMANDFFHSGNDELHQAAIEWSQKADVTLAARQPSVWAWGTMREE